ncbi:TIGR01841 family phasin [Paraburkholderia sp. USG1]|uniref:TIGR01841 family phasin n=1 Tax=Paraburkholderia sp. USG1 TaxID=2952268 RepID=UPI00285BFF41|nr:TIGR01841 family phasin [Paraburkholderia sp. USG1]MDR8400407.1 TIGR01841 family phasin [Paraburkholderia sp. USG1]
MDQFPFENLMQFYKSTASTFFSLANEAVEGVQKLAELNLQAGHTVLAESVTRLRETLPDAAGAAWLASPLHLAQSAAGKTLAYQQHVNAIAVATQSASAKIIDAQYDQFGLDLQAGIDSWAKHAPAGSETVVIAVKSTFSTASNTAETVRKSVRSVVEAAQANVSAVAAGVSRNVAPQSGARA